MVLQKTDLLLQNWKHQTIIYLDAASETQTMLLKKTSWLVLNNIIASSHIVD